jgi:hypothetical protein
VVFPQYAAGSCRDLHSLECASVENLGYLFLCARDREEVE